MENPLFSGTCTALVTPFEDDHVNFDMLACLLERQILAQIPAVVLCGTTGESATLSDAEKLDIFRFAKNTVGDRIKIICGTGSNHTAHAVQLSMAAEEAGADALLLVSPYYNKGNQQGLLEHFSTIAYAVNIPIILYNVPSRTGLDMPVSLYQQLSQIPNIIGVKEASTDIVKIARIRNACGEDFTVWCGNDDQAVPAIALGAKGVISVLSNIIPADVAKLCDLVLNGKMEEAIALNDKLLPVANACFVEVNPIPVKEAMNLIGFDAGVPRAPLTKIEDANREKLIVAMQAYGLEVQA